MLLALRVLAWAFLLPPWSGFDEPFHHGYVESWADDPGWRRFESVALPERLLSAMRRWPTVPAYAAAFHTRRFDGGPPAPGAVPRAANYETLQSPLYYAAFGMLLRALPRLDPIAELYLLRGLNALLAFSVGILVLAAARRIGLGTDAWIAPAILAFIPGFAQALSRVSNDGLCALLVSAGIGLSLRSTRSQNGPEMAGAAAAGLSPWAKLYGWPAIPALAFRAWRNDGSAAPSKVRRILATALLLVPGALLAVLSRRKHGSSVSMLEVLDARSSVSPAHVPWLRDIWTIAKSHLWISGMDKIVFPTAVYVPLVAALVVLAVTGLRRLRRDRPLALQLVVPLALFAAALAFFSWKNYAYFRQPGGAGGWYLWAMALPEALILAAGAASGSVSRRSVLVLFAAFLVLTIAGDAAVALESVGRLVVTSGNHHILGLADAGFVDLVSRFAASRPAGIAVGAFACAGASYLAGAATLFAARKRPS